MAGGRRAGQLEIQAGRDGAQRELLLPVMQVIRVEEVAGGPLLVAAVAALLWANLAPEHYHHAWETTLTVGIAGLSWEPTLHHLINDLLLPLFFFVAGMELKRELVRGALSSVRAAALPLVMAIGGMAVPALVFLLVAWDTPAVGGWGVPVATDIAFALALVAVLGDRVPNQVRIALLAFAALDDVGGVIVIATTYQSTLSAGLLALAGVLLAVSYALQRLPLVPGPLPVISGALAFAAVMASGLHPTLAGIALGLTVPASPLIDRGHYLKRNRELAEELEECRRRRKSGDADTAAERAREDALLGRLEALTIGTESVLDRLTRGLNPWVSYLVLPLFALANGGVTLNADALTVALSGAAFWAVAAGLVVGKPLGIITLTWLAVRLGLVHLPRGMGWGDVAGLGLVAGIGFTVSLFIADLAFAGPLLAAAKLGILAASLLAGLLGVAILYRTHRDDPRDQER